MDIIMALAVFLSFFIKGVTGFGNTLVLNSVLSFHLSNTTISPLDLILGFPSNCYLAWKERKCISVKEVTVLSLLALAGLIPGALFLKVGNERHIKIILGIVIIVLGVEMFLRLRNARKLKPNKVFLLFVGIVSGFLCGLFGIGAFLVAYVGRTAENQSQFRGNLCCVFLVENFVRLLIYASTGILSADIFKNALIMFPSMAVGLAAGVAASGHMKERTVKSAVIALLIVSGISLVLKNIF